MRTQDFFSLIQSRKLPVVVNHACFLPIFQKYFDTVCDAESFDFQKAQPVMLVSLSVEFAAEVSKKIFNTHHAYIMFLPLASHLFACHVADNQEQIIDYTLRALCTVNLNACLQAISNIAAQVQPQKTLRIEHQHTHLLVWVHSVNQFYCPTQLKPGDLLIPFLFFEYGLLQSPKHNRFEINGTFSFCSMLVGSTIEPQDVANHKNQLLSAIRHSKHCVMTIKNTEIESLKIDDQEYITVLDSMGVSRKIVELAFGVNKNLHADFDRNINSPMNEGVLGMHLGVGTGKNQYHIDFISTDTNFNHCTVE